ncbi:MAG: hypothetical protein IT181_13015 [Acidobacteria bacterium]|nr:hypothetical protein [Acidobacteriota bacterium]
MLQPPQWLDDDDAPEPEQAPAALESAMQEAAEDHARQEAELVDDEGPEDEELARIPDPGGPPDPVAPEQQLEARNLSLVEQANALQVVDAASFDRAGDVLRVLAEAEARVHNFMDEDIQRAHAAWKGLTEKRRGMLEPIETARRALGMRYAEFDRADQARAEKERRDREAAAQKAEQDRLEAEAAELRRQADEAPDPHQADRILAEAVQVEQEARAVERPVLATQRTVTPTKGVSSRSNWTCQVDDKLALIKAVAEGRVSLEAVEPSMTYLRARAKADKQGFVCPGVRVYDAATVAVRR